MVSFGKKKISSKSISEWPQQYCTVFLHQIKIIWQDSDTSESTRFLKEKMTALFINVVFLGLFDDFFGGAVHKLPL